MLELWEKGSFLTLGGYNIKTAIIKLMKVNFGSEAATFGAARPVGDFRRPDVEAHFIMAAWDNMIGPPALVLATSSRQATVARLRSCTPTPRAG